MNANKKTLIVIFGVFMGSIYSCYTAKKTYDRTNNSNNISMKIIDSTYWIGPEQNGVFLVSKNGFFGLADQNGNLLSEVIYDRIFPFSEGKAIMCQNKRYGLLDANGKVITPPVYDYLEDFSNGLCYGYTTNSEFVLLNLKGENIVPGKNIRISSINGRYVQLKDRSVFVFNRQGQKVFSTDFFAFTGIWDKWNELKYRWFNSRITQNIEGFQREFDIPQNLPFYFNDGLAVVPELNGDKVKFGYIDTTGKQVIPFVFDEAKCFIDGYACAKKNNNWGVINKLGNWVIQPVYENLDNANGNYFVYTENKLEGVIDLNGEIRIQPNFIKINFLYDVFFAVLESNEFTTSDDAKSYLNRTNCEPSEGIPFWGCLSAQNGDTVLPFKYNEIIKLTDFIGAGINYQFIEHYTEEYHRATRMALGQLPPINYLGKAVVTTFTNTGIKERYQAPDKMFYGISHSPSFYHIKEIELCKIVDSFLFIGNTFLDRDAKVITNQQLITELKSKLSGGKPVITENVTHSLGAKLPNGKQILPIEFEYLRIVNTGIIAKKNGKYGFYDFKGNLIIEHKYSYINEHLSGLLEVAIDEPSPYTPLQMSLINKFGIQIKNF